MREWIFVTSSRSKVVEAERILGRFLQDREAFGRSTGSVPALRRQRRDRAGSPGTRRGRTDLGRRQRDSRGDIPSRARLPGGELGRGATSASEGLRADGGQRARGEPRPGQVRPRADETVRRDGTPSGRAGRRRHPPSDRGGSRGFEASAKGTGPGGVDAVEDRDRQSAMRLPGPRALIEEGTLRPPATAARAAARVAPTSGSASSSPSKTSSPDRPGSGSGSSADPDVSGRRRSPARTCSAAR